jgi:TPR repeat protein
MRWLIFLGGIFSCFSKSDCLAGLLCLKLKDPQKANIFFEKGSKDGDPVAMKALADSYLTGHGVEKNPTKALIWYVISADLGYGPAQLTLGFILKNGEAIVKNSQLSTHYFKKAMNNKTLELPQQKIAQERLNCCILSK